MKVITKLANIELTPEKPEYAGGSWHVEGTINEDIVATVLYYYDCDNIVDSRLSFRAGIGAPEYEQGDEEGMKEYYGLENEDLLVSRLGAVDTVEDRVVVFPNVFQHHVDGFRLADVLRPGHRKIVCFFVCDPHNTEVVGTDRVPYQQAAWVAQAAAEGRVRLAKETWETAEAGGMLMEEAKAVRVELMAERLVEADDDENWEWEWKAYKNRFSLCEH